MSRIISVSQSIQSKNDSILYAIILDNFIEIRKLITEANVNSVIDTKNNYTSLHYAVKTNNERLITFLLNMGANPKIQTNTGEDSFDLSLKYQSKHVIVHELTDKTETNRQLTTDISSLEKKISVLNENNKYLIKTADEGLVKNTLLKTQLNELKSENSSLKEEVIHLKEDLNKSKRKYDSLDESYTKLINKMRK